VQVLEKKMYELENDEKKKPLEKFGYWIGKKLGKGGVIIPVVRLHGVIASDQKPNRINLQSVNPMLEKAFKMKKAPVVAIVINSPGGSPVQSRLVANRIAQLSIKHEKKVLVFIEDVAASGGYFIAVVGSEIFADPSSIVGSIGVVMGGFGFDEAIKKIGVSRRLYVSGKNKSTLDPFLPEKKTDVERIKKVGTEIHKTFIDYVKTHRGDKLKAKDDMLFTGEWWTGVSGLDLGLIDAIGDMHEVLRERYGDDVSLKIIEAKKSLFQIPSFGLSTGINASSIAGEAISAIEERALWSRFGL